MGHTLSLNRAPRSLKSGQKPVVPISLVKARMRS